MALRRLRCSPVITWLEENSRLAALMWNRLETAHAESALFVATLLNSGRQITGLVPGLRVSWRLARVEVTVFFGANWEHFRDELKGKRFDTIWFEDYPRAGFGQRQPMWREMLAKIHGPAHVGHGYDITEPVQKGMPDDPFAPPPGALHQPIVLADDRPDDAVHERAQPNAPDLARVFTGLPLRGTKQMRAAAALSAFELEEWNIPVQIKPPLRAWEDELSEWHRSGTEPGPIDALAAACAELKLKKD